MSSHSTELRRRRARRNAVLIPVVVVALYAAGIVVWNITGRIKLNGAIAAIHARGWRAIKSDFTPPPEIPDDQNAAFFLDRAAKAFKSARGYEDVCAWKLPNILPLTDEESRVVGNTIASNATALADARCARALPRAHWKVPLNPLWDMGFSCRGIKEQRGLADFLGNAALWNHQQGNDAEAVEDLRDLLRQGRACQHWVPNMFSELVGIGLQSLAADHARQIAPDLSPAARKQARALIAELFDERHYVASWPRAVAGDRVMIGESFSQYERRFFVAGYVCRQVAAALRRTIPLANAGATPNFPSACAVLAPVPENQGIIEGIYQVTERRSLQTYYQGLTERRSAAILLALRLYQLDHGGSLPLKLSDLAPDYVPAVPLDPFAISSRPFGYSGPSSRDPYVYCVGTDGIDNSASTQPAEPLRADEDINDVDRWGRLDAVFYFYRRPKPPPQSPAD